MPQNTVFQPAVFTPAAHRTAPDPTPANTVSARPQRSGSERRRRNGPQIGVRLDALEYEAIRLRAEAAGLTPPDYLRRKGLGSVARLRQKPERPDQAVRHQLQILLGHAGRIGNNANQLARHMNTAAKAGRPVPLDVMAIRELQASLRALRAELRRALGIEDVA